MKKVFNFKNIRATFQTNFDQLRKTVDQKEMERKLQEVIDQKILPTLEKGLSPVQGSRKLKPYSESYKTQIKRGRYAEYGKKPTPSTLKLSGDLLSNYKSKADRRLIGASIGIQPESSLKIKELATYHQDGTDKMPARPFIPKQGERFISRIDSALRRSFLDVINNAVKKLRGK